MSDPDIYSDDFCDYSDFDVSSTFISLHTVYIKNFFNKRFFFIQIILDECLFLSGFSSGSFSKIELCNFSIFGGQYFSWLFSMA